MNRKKLSVNRLATGNLKMHKKRYAVLIIGIILAMIFSSGSVFFISCMNSSKLAINHKKIGKQGAITVNVEKEQLDALIDKNMVDKTVGYAHVVAFAFNPEKEPKYGTPIAWLDDVAKDYYCQTVTEGRFPEAAGEIAIERTVLARIDKSALVGSEITLLTLIPDGKSYQQKVVEKTYTLVGILYDKRKNFESSIADDFIYDIPAAFVCEKELPELGGKENLVAFYDFVNGEDYYTKVYDFNAEFYMNTVQTSNSWGFSPVKGEDVSSDTTVAVILSLMLTIGSCFVIVNSFASNLNERKKQIGLFRAVGATKRQIIKIFGREAFIISLICAPISILVSYFAVKLFAHLMGEYFIFVPDFTVLIITTAVSIACVMLAALLPLFRISRISPMQAIRNTELMRRMKNKRIHSQKNFNASSLLAKRNMMFSRFRQVTVCLLLVLTIVISCLGLSYVQANRYSQYELRSDYQLLSIEHGIVDAFVNYENYAKGLSENVKQEIASLPEVAVVSGSKEFKINMLVNGEYPDYLMVNDYAGAGKYEEACETEYVPLEERKISTSYLEAKNKGGYSQEFFSSFIRAYDSYEFERLKDSVIDGKINIDKLNNGEEIVVFAPKKVGYYFKSRGSVYWTGYLVDMSQKPYKVYDEEIDEKYIHASAESCFRAGDEITLSTLVAKDEYDSNPKRYDKTVKIGAVINSDSAFSIWSNSAEYFGGVTFYTTTSGINNFGYQIGYDDLRIMLKDECTAEIDEYMTGQLQAISPDSYNDSLFGLNESWEQEYRSSMVMLLTAILLFGCICAALINNSVTAQIRESKRTIGTLRAVGASMKDLTRCYSLQILSMLGTGTIVGSVIYTVAHLIIRKYVELSYSIWAGLLVALVLFAVCFINLRQKVGKLTKDSVVNNIREL